MKFFKKFFQGDKDNNPFIDPDDQPSSPRMACGCHQGEHEDGYASDEEVYDLMCSLHWDVREFFVKYGQNHGYRCDMRDGNSSGVDFSTPCCQTEELMSDLVFPTFVNLRESIKTYNIVDGLRDSVELMEALDAVFLKIEQGVIDRYNLHNELGDDD